VEVEFAFSNSLVREEKEFWDLRLRSAKDIGLPRIVLDLVFVTPAT
jgi:hypothetical protein